MLAFYSFMLSLLPLSMIGIGLLWRQKRSPKKVNPIMGYRTPGSMRSQATWDFAHQYFGAIWFALGAPMGLVSLALVFAFKNSNQDVLDLVVVIITCAQVAVMLLPIIPTEIALKKRFDEHGNPR